MKNYAYIYYFARAATADADVAAAAWHSRAQEQNKLPLLTLMNSTNAKIRTNSEVNLHKPCFQLGVCIYSHLR